MPHVVIEHSANIDLIKEDILKLAHETVIQSGLFSRSDIKTRIYSASDFLVGDKGSDGSFLHISVAIKQGRSAEQRKALSAALLEKFSKAFPAIDQLTVEIRELDTDSYQKYSGTK